MQIFSTRFIGETVQMNGSIGSLWLNVKNSWPLKLPSSEFDLFNGPLRETWWNWTHTLFLAFINYSGCLAKDQPLLTRSSFKAGASSVHFPLSFKLSLRYFPYILFMIRHCASLQRETTRLRQEETLLAHTWLKNWSFLVREDGLFPSSVINTHSFQLFITSPLCTFYFSMASNQFLQLYLLSQLPGQTFQILMALEDIWGEWERFVLLSQ